MPESWIEVVYINFHKAILNGCISNTLIEQELTEEQKAIFYDLMTRHDNEVQQLLRSFVKL